MRGKRNNLGEVLEIRLVAWQILVLAIYYYFSNY